MQGVHGSDPSRDVAAAPVLIVRVNTKWRWAILHT